MTEITSENTNTDTAKPRLRAGRRIEVGDDFLEPRKDFAAAVGITDPAAARLNLRTTYIGRVAHVFHHESRKELADRAKRRREPQRQRKSVR
jgi:hypothetical protein